VDGIADRQELGVRRGIARALALVVPRRHDAVADDDDRTDGDVVVVERRPGFVEGGSHGLLVIHRRCTLTVRPPASGPVAARRSTGCPCPAPAMH
jgi:hypothetical protein